MVSHAPACTAVRGFAVTFAFLLALGDAAAQSTAPAEPEPRAVRPGPTAGQGNLVGHGGPIKAIRVDTATGRALTGSFDYAMAAWDVSGDEPRRLHRLHDHEGAINAVAFLPGAKRALAAGDDGAVALWDLGTGKLIHRFAGHTAKVVGLAVSADGRWAASASWDHTAKLWDLAALTDGPVLQGHNGPVNAVAFSGDGAQVYTAGADGTIALHARADGAFVRPLLRHGWGINVLERLSGTDRLVFGALNGTVAIIEGASGEIVRELPAHTRPVLAVAIVEKPGLVATGGGDGLIRVVRIDDGAVLEEHRNIHGPVWALAFTAEGRALYYGGLDDFAALWQRVPRQPFEPVQGGFPRRFQIQGDAGNLVAEGELQFARKCSICHTLGPDGANRAGPTLHNLFGRRIASLAGYPFSEALRRLDIVWSEETVSRLFEQGPDVVTPGSKMPLQRITDRHTRDALVAYLKAATVDPPIDAAPPNSQGSGQSGDKR